MTEHRPRTPSFDTADTVNRIIVEYPAAVSIFNAFGIDACCGGDASLEEAARRDGASLDALIEALNTTLINRGGDTP